jgi:hypothetical protein
MGQLLCEVVAGQRGAQGTFSSLPQVEEEGRGVLEHSGLSP